MIRALLLVLLMVGLIFRVSAQSDSSMSEIVERVRLQFAPDKRVAVFQVAVGDSGQLSGKTNLPEAKAALLSTLHQVGLTYDDKIELLPAAELRDLSKGVVRLSVANIRSKPANSAEMSTQGLLGMPLRVWDKEGDWFLIQTPDGYLGWMDAHGFQLMDEEQFSSWNTARKVIITNPFTFTYQRADENSQTVSDLVAGDILKFVRKEGRYFEVEYPDGRGGFILQKSALLYTDWLSSLSFSEDDLERTARKMLGIPYLWGGTSYKGMDCSGFTKTVYFLNGWILPRDASQQVRIGQLVDTSKGFANLRKGDLLFFGTPASAHSSEIVSHVGMWLGENKFIHASGLIRISSMDPSSPDFDVFNSARFLRARRILGSGPELRLSK